MKESSIRAAFMRGGTSKGLVFNESDLPADWELRQRIFLSALGSPDPDGRQLDGMGGGTSSTSKVCIVAPPTRPDADLDFTFVQVGVVAPTVDLSANCGNMSSAVALFAIEEGLVPPVDDSPTIVRIHNTNTKKIVVAHVSRGSVDGGPGPVNRVQLDFLDPAGGTTGSLLPTASTLDELHLADGTRIPVTLVDLAIPCVFLTAASVGLHGSEMPADINADTALLDRFESIRIQASIRMGISRTTSEAAAKIAVPKVVIVSPPQDTSTLSGVPLRADSIDILARTISVGRAHSAVPLTAALCLGASINLPGSIPASVAKGARAESSTRANITVGHPSGITEVSSRSVQGENGPIVTSATVQRTARRLFDGSVHVRL